MKVTIIAYISSLIERWKLLRNRHIIDLLLKTFKVKYRNVLFCQ